MRGGAGVGRSRPFRLFPRLCRLNRMARPIEGGAAMRRLMVRAEEVGGRSSREAWSFEKLRRSRGDVVP